jgi:hypothetical protein
MKWQTEKGTRGEIGTISVLTTNAGGGIGLKTYGTKKFQRPLGRLLLKCNKKRNERTETASLEQQRNPRRNEGTFTAAGAQ